MLNLKEKLKNLETEEYLVSIANQDCSLESILKQIFPIKTKQKVSVEGNLGIEYEYKGFASFETRTIPKIFIEETNDINKFLEVLEQKILKRVEYIYNYYPEEVNEKRIKFSLYVAIRRGRKISQFHIKNFLEISIRNIYTLI